MTVARPRWVRADPKWINVMLSQEKDLVMELGCGIPALAHQDSILKSHCRNVFFSLKTIFMYEKCTAIIQRLRCVWALFSKHLAKYFQKEYN